MLQEYVTVHPGFFLSMSQNLQKWRKYILTFLNSHQSIFEISYFFLKQIIEDMISEYRIFCMM